MCFINNRKGSGRRYHIEILRLRKNHAIKIKRRLELLEYTNMEVRIEFIFFL